MLWLNCGVSGRHATARVENLEGIGCWQCVMYVPELDSFAIGGCVTQEEKQVVCFMGNMVKTRTEREATLHGIEEGLQFFIEELYVDEEELTVCVGNKNLVQWIVGVKGTHGYRETDSTAVVTTEETAVQEVNETDKVEEEGGEQMESADGNTANATADETTISEKNEVLKVEVEDGEPKELADGTIVPNLYHASKECQLPETPVDMSEFNIQHDESLDSVVNDQVEGSTNDPGESQGMSDVQQNNQEEANEDNKQERVQAEGSVERVSSIQPDMLGDSDKRDKADTSVLHAMAVEENDASIQAFTC
ncbi:hypothetical protein PIB30_021667 [Stylosanthes scabra]|uniref:Uncharacterized protein n=1 Tax=Stylosanthes scabra TaxID=79078 RepID=A0ABU6Z5N8_9FABA|nr:hypothetical protein [Stylosanthes scabra]